MHAVDYYLGNGISRVILGSAALHNPTFVKAAVSKHREKIAVGIDARKGLVSIEGWLKNSSINYLDFAREMEHIGVRNIIYTDIAKDGTLSGPNLPHLALLHNAVSSKITASGGIASISDIVDLRTVGVYGAICGKSLYKGTLDLHKAIRIADMPIID
jgi:phosphoribosylformimino-5-aminoimidazole carboxamide ribotide isomerase